MRSAKAELTGLLRSSVFRDPKAAVRTHTRHVDELSRCLATGLDGNIYVTDMGTVWEYDVATGAATAFISSDLTQAYGIAFVGGPPPPGPHMGDANEDRKVDLQDYSLLKAYYNQTGQGWDHGNFNGDNIVDLQDFSILKDNFGTTGSFLTAMI